MPSLSDLNNQKVGNNLDIDPSLITFTAGTDPSDPVYRKYSYVITGKQVTVTFRAEYDVAGATVTVVQIAKPTDLPTPASVGTVDDNRVLTLGSGGWSNGGNATNSGLKAEIGKVTGGDWQFRIFTASSAPKFFFGTFTYIAE